MRKQIIDYVYEQCDPDCAVKRYTFTGWWERHGPVDWCTYCETKTAQSQKFAKSLKRRWLARLSQKLCHGRISDMLTGWPGNIYLFLDMNAKLLNRQECFISTTCHILKALTAWKDGKSRNNELWELHLGNGTPIQKRNPHMKRECKPLVPISSVNDFWLQHGRSTSHCAINAW